MEFIEIIENKKRYLSLLLLADEQEDMINRYIDRGRMFALIDNEVMTICIVTDEGDGVLEIKNIATEPSFQRKGYGKKLLDYSLEKAKMLGYGAVCFEGNIGFYGKSGFTFAREFGIRYHGLPAGADDSFFLCKELLPGYLHGVTGEYAPPQVYLVDPQQAEVFAKNFPPKEKLKLPGQLF